MPRLSRKSESSELKADVLQVIHHEIPDTAAGAGAAPIPETAATTPATGMTWRGLLHGVTIAEAVGMTALFIAGTLYGLEFFAPLVIAAVLFGVASLWMRRQTKAATVYSLVVTSLALVMFGGLFFGWTGFFYITSWFEVAFATMAVILPIAGIVAATKTLRHKGSNDARVPTLLTAGLSTAIVLVSVVGSIASSDAPRLPGDVSLSAQNFEWTPKALTAKAGDVAIYFDNKDPFVHNVSIKGHGTSDDAGGRQAIRHVFPNMTAGTYEFFCEIHTDMKGTLTVT